MHLWKFSVLIPPQKKTLQRNEFHRDIGKRAVPEIRMKIFLRITGFTWEDPSIYAPNVPIILTLCVKRN